MDNSCDSSNYFKNTSNIKANSNQIKWVGGDIPCLSICNNTTLTAVETKIAKQVCALMAATDVSELVLPSCLTDLWGARQDDETILTFLSFILEQLCVQIEAILEINATLDTIDPFVTIDLSCCSGDCVSTGTIKLSDALTSLATCICQQKSRIDELESDLATTNTNLTSLQTQLDEFTTLMLARTQCLPCA